MTNFGIPPTQPDSGLLTENLPVLAVLAIFIVANKGEPAQEIDSVVAMAGLGLEGDRYAKKTGAFSGTKRIPDEYRQVSLISRQGIGQANLKIALSNKEPFTEAETRRNLVVDISADELNSLVDKKFIVDGVLMEGVELCTPCNRPSMLADKPEFEQAFEGKGGLRARVLETGKISLSKIGSDIVN